MAQNGVIFRYNHLRRGVIIIAGGQIFKIAASGFVNVSGEEINLMKEIAISKKHVTKFGMTLFKGQI